MRLGILSRNAKCYSTARLKAAALHRGHKVNVLDTVRFAITLEKEFPDLYYRGKPLSTYDAVIPRNWGFRDLLWNGRGAAIRTDGRLLR